jgi:MYXO-CTERM domain-containing protein
LACDDGFACQTTTGKCVDKGCETMTCAAGQICSMGKCMDACEGVKCASDQECKAGRCTDLPKSATGGSNGNPGTGGRSGTGGAATGGAGTGGAVTGGAPGTGGSKAMPGTGGDGEMVKVNGCSCALGEHGPTGIFAGFGVLGAALALALRRRRP